MQGIYAICNTVHGGCYFGSSKDIVARWWGHHRALESGEHCNWKLQRAWIKYGKAAFFFFILEIVEDSKLLERHEHEWLGIGYYNLCDLPGRPPDYGHPSPWKDQSLPAEWCENLKRAYTPERRAALSDLRKAHPEWHADWKASPEVLRENGRLLAELNRTPKYRQKVSEFSKAHPEYIQRAAAASHKKNMGRKYPDYHTNAISVGLKRFHKRIRDGLAMKCMNHRCRQSTHCAVDSFPSDHPAHKELRPICDECVQPSLEQGMLVRKIKGFWRGCPIIVKEDPEFNLEAA